MDIERSLQQLPKPLLAALVMFGAVIVFMIMNPPHSICQTQQEGLRKDLAGWLLPVKVGKRTNPAPVRAALRNCRLGASSGACFQYFTILRRVAIAAKNGSSECLTDLLEIPIDGYAKMEVYQPVQEQDKVHEELTAVKFDTVPLGQVLSEGLQFMITQAWGEAPPEPGPNRFGWYQEFELSVFCHLQDVVRRAKGPEEWPIFQKLSVAKLPGEPPAPKVGELAAPPQKLATAVLSPEHILERSLFSTSC